MKRVLSLLGAAILALILCNEASAQALNMPPNDPLDLVRRTAEALKGEDSRATFMCWNSDETKDGIGSVFRMVVRVPYTNNPLLRSITNIGGYEVFGSAGGDTELHNTIAGDDGEDFCPPPNAVRDILLAAGWKLNEGGFWDQPGAAPAPPVVVNYQPVPPATNASPALIFIALLALIMLAGAKKISVI